VNKKRAVKWEKLFGKRIQGIWVKTEIGLKKGSKRDKTLSTSGPDNSPRGGKKRPFRYKYEPQGRGNKETEKRKKWVEKEGMAGGKATLGNKALKTEKGRLRPPCQRKTEI